MPYNDAKDGHNVPIIPTVLTEHEAAQILKQSVQTMRNNRFLRRGVPYLKQGRSVRYLLSDIEQYLINCRIDPEAAR